MKQSLTKKPSTERAVEETAEGRHHDDECGNNADETKDGHAVTGEVVGWHQE